MRAIEHKGQIPGGGLLALDVLAPGRTALYAPQTVDVYVALSSRGRGHGQGHGSRDFMGLYQRLFEELREDVFGAG